MVAMMRQSWGHRQLLGTLCLLAALVEPQIASSKPLCRDAMFHCRVGDAFTGTNLRRLIANKKSLRWVKKYCSLTPTSLEPARCDWRRSLRSRQLARQPTQAANKASRAERRPRIAAPPGYDPGRVRQPPSAPPSTPAKQPNRDVRGRYSTTPAPARLPKVSAKDTTPFATDVNKAANRYHLPADLIRAVMKVESNYNPTVTSHAGAVGLMQLMPSTAKAMGVTDRRDPLQNIMGGARFLRVLANRFQGDLVKVLSAYHAGSSRVRKRGGTPYAATDSYVRKVLGVYYALRDR